MVQFKVRTYRTYSYFIKKVTNIKIMATNKATLAPDKSIIAEFLNDKGQANKTGIAASSSSKITANFNAKSNSMSKPSSLQQTTAAAGAKTDAKSKSIILPFKYEPALAPIGKEFIDPREKKKIFRHDFKLTGVDFSPFEIRNEN